MNFRTNIQLQKEHNQIDYCSKLFLIGSCFSEHIYNKLDYYKFKAFSNPFGILFNPIAIENLITKAINKEEFNQNNTFKLNERWHCFEAHSDLSNPSEDELIKNLNTTIKTTHIQIKKTSHLIITLGTARVYRHLKSDKIVANCHKVPQKQFSQELLSIKEITDSLKNIIELVKAVNPSINIIFTVSPVRHLKDGFVENMESKAHLISAIQQLTNKQKKLYYFPSFEIMMDDLRDYRFYNNDMVHPNETAINYIWEQFQQVWVNEKSTSLMKEVDTIQRGLAHKPFNPNSIEHQLFLKKLQQKISQIREKSNISF
ncbi:GSCFA domain-containing protein [Lutibacter citreus]|uniref:GSCFA domain-containing protein n=1 Tax=Lutibacter citreus TaxID=2138210 RepID=UPI000DBEA8FD|nr:GSCFA domain-containing protein [Lutibacter citreus]